MEPNPGVLNVTVLLHTTTSVLAQGFLALLQQQERNIAYASVGDFEQLVASAETIRPDVVLIDVAERVDFACLEALRDRCPECRIVLWTASISVEMAHYARCAGISGVLRKDAADELMMRCIRTVAEGGLWFERSLLNSLLQVREVHLSPRERQLLRLIAQGYSNKQIGGELMISEGTVKVYLAKLFRKVGVHDRYELALHGLRSLGVSNIDIGAAQQYHPASFPTSVVVATMRHR